MWCPEILLLAATLRTIAAANCSLTRPEDVRLAAALDLATTGCGTVVYTTLAYGPGTRLPHPATRLAEMAREGGACYILVAGAASAVSLAAHCDVRPWRVVSAGGASGRRASRAVKLRPLLFFRKARYVVFVDWKLRLLQAPSLLVSAMLRDAGFAAFRHPCTAAHTPPTRSPCNHRRPGDPWWRAEAREIARRGVVANVDALREQIQRYSRAGPLVEYVDGALLVWDTMHPVAGALSCAWWAEYSREDSSDRDQLAFARAITSIIPPDPADDPARSFGASTRRSGVLIISEGGGRPGACRGLCHQYDATGTAVAPAGARVLSPINKAPEPCRAVK
jgi:hypothetical protein